MSDALPIACPGPTLISGVVPAHSNGTPPFHKLNPNCCYKCCIGCSSVKKLRDFQRQHPTDWEAKLRGSQRLLTPALLIR